MPAELAEAKRLGLVPQDFEPPEPLYKQCENDKTKKPGTWYWEWNDPKNRMCDRRFVILDGFNRFTCLNILLLEDPTYLDKRAIGCQLMKINVFDGLAIQLSTMKINKVTQTTVGDTLPDKLQQFQSIANFVAQGMDSGDPWRKCEDPYLPLIEKTSSDAKKKTLREKREKWQKDCEAKKRVERANISRITA